MKNFSIKPSIVYAAAALVLGSLGAVVTMFFHPTGHDLLGQPEEIARRNEMITVMTHSLALFSLPLLFYGFLGFSRALGGLDRLSVAAAMVAYGFASLGGMCAVVINGLVAPVITRQILTADGEAKRELLHLILMNHTLLNQAFTKIFVAASSLAIVFWSVRLFGAGRFGRIVAVFGFLVGSVSLSGLFTGQLRLNVHGFGLVVFGQTIWTILAAVFLFRQIRGSEWQD